MSSFVTLSQRRRARARARAGKPCRLRQCEGRETGKWGADGGIAATRPPGPETIPGKNPGARAEWATRRENALVTNIPARSTEGPKSCRGNPSARRMEGTPPKTDPAPESSHGAPPHNTGTMCARYDDRWTRSLPFIARGRGCRESVGNCPFPLAVFSPPLCCPPRAIGGWWMLARYQHDRGMVGRWCHHRTGWGGTRMAQGWERDGMKVRAWRGVGYTTIYARFVDREGGLTDRVVLTLSPSRYDTQIRIQAAIPS